jgi:hypothetical protein
MRTGYEEQWIDCCLTCKRNDRIERVLVCTIHHEPTHPLGICNDFEMGEIPRMEDI